MHLFVSEVRTHELQIVGQGMIRMVLNVIKEEFHMIPFQEGQIDVIAKDSERTFVF
jgi:hypothetical protein